MALFENLQALIDLLGDAPSVAEMTLVRPGGEQITIKRPAGSVPATQPPQTREPEASVAYSGLPAATAFSPTTLQPTLLEGDTALPASSKAAPAFEVAANRVGIYHPAKPPVELGAQVSAGQIVGYIEAIKLMNEVRSTSAGIIAEQFVEDGMPVEYGQPLFEIDPR